MIRVAIADDHAIVRRGLKEILAGEPDMKVSGEAADAQELLDLVRKRACDVVVLDITMPGKDGLEVLKELQRKWPKLPVLIFTMHAEDQFGVRALRAGAAGYLTKESAPAELVKAIRRVVVGRKYMSPSLAEQWAGDPHAGQSLHQTLSDREFQVLGLIASGKTVSEIGQKLGLSVKTISTYRARILQKLCLRNTAELIQYAIRNEIIP